MLDSYTLQLAQEYVRLVNDMRSGLYSHAELHQMDSDRQWVHRELCRVLHVGLDTDMYRRAQDMLHEARGLNLQ